MTWENDWWRFVLALVIIPIYVFIVYKFMIFIANKLKGKKNE